MGSDKMCTDIGEDCCFFCDSYKFLVSWGRLIRPKNVGVMIDLIRKNIPRYSLYLSIYIRILRYVIFFLLSTAQFPISKAFESNTTDLGLDGLESRE